MYKTELCVVMPVYNEEGAIGTVLQKWMGKLDSLHIRYQIHAYNDGSKDRSGEILNSESLKYGGRLVVHNKPNSGHGPTILQGYRELSSVAEWIFQVDSDDEMEPIQFDELWSRRSQYDLLIGIRDGRMQPLSRKIISLYSRLVVRLFYGQSVWDVNCPYRLMRSRVFASIFQTIPLDTFAPNIILTGCVARQKLRFFEFPIPHGDRKTGEVSIKKWKLFKSAVKSFKQTVVFSLKSKR